MQKMKTEIYDIHSVLWSILNFQKFSSKLKPFHIENPECIILVAYFVRIEVPEITK